MRRLLPMLLLFFCACDGGGPESPDVVEPVAEIVFADPVGVVAVIDGDTLLVARGGSTFKVRLRGIDTPELNKDSEEEEEPEPFAEEAREKAMTLSGLEVGLEYDADCEPVPGPVCLDPFDRLLVYIRLSSGDDLGESIVRQGLAELMVFSDQPFDRLDAYVAALAAAQEEDLGIWSQ
jgi:endonuclease YncB( thermonuclease family)